MRGFLFREGIHLFGEEKENQGMIIDTPAFIHGIVILDGRGDGIDKLFSLDQLFFLKVVQYMVEEPG